MEHLGTGQCNSAAASCDKEELGCVLCGKPWQWEPQGGKDARCGGLAAAASLGRVGGRAGPATIHVRGQGHLARARDADGQLHTHHRPCISDCIQSKLVKFVLESWQKDSFCLFQPEQHLTPTLSLQYKKSLQSCAQNGSHVLRGRNAGRDYQVRFSNPLSSEN